MGINTAINTALTGLGATTRAAEIVARNVANSKVSGYSKLELQTGQATLGGEGSGVEVRGVLRSSDPFLAMARMRAESSSELAKSEAAGFRKLADLVNDPKGGDSLQKRFQDVDNALRALADTPESSAVRQTVEKTSGALARRFNAISTQARQMRMDADKDIQTQVKIVNTALKRIEGLNGEIDQAMATGRDSSALEDERQRQLDVVNAHIPIKARGTGRGQMMVTTETGGILVQGKAMQLTFKSTGAITGYNELGGIGLKGPDGEVVMIGKDPEANPAPAGMQKNALPNLFTGGKLEAAFNTRDKTVPAFMAKIDKLAADLASRMQSLNGFDDGTVEAQAAIPDDPGTPLVDESQPAVAAVDAFRTGLFVDIAQHAPTPPATTPLKGDEIRYDAANLEGFAGRIRLTKEVNTDLGGDPKVLEGKIDLDAVPTPKNHPGNMLQSTASTEPFPGALFAAFRPQAETPTDSYFKGFVNIAAEFGAEIEGNAAGPATDATYKAAALDAIRQEELGASAVDTDREMQTMLELEKAYAANARVMTVANQMIQTLLESV